MKIVLKSDKKYFSFFKYCEAQQQNVYLKVWTNFSYNRWTGHDSFILNFTNLTQLDAYHLYKHHKLATNQSSNKIFKTNQIPLKAFNT